ncbi:membrane protein [Actinocatenispora thailandica]|uniref:Membrane protein n=1 Tax=Actinocatenispora thailandica TaxID=227318 RepID=A0A7R7DJX4_9ACTN|nr:MMPL family transporter [Actinocatenispora thailandica]BCJ33087.1 membrane protein [Actinocatenispora thailandica]
MRPRNTTQVRPEKPARTASAPAGPLARLAGGCYRHRWLVVACWLIATSALLVLGFRYAAAADHDFSGGASESAHAQALLRQHFADQNGDTLTLAVTAKKPLTDRAVRARVESLLGALSDAPHIVAVADPYRTPGQISGDRHTGYATIRSSQDQISADTVTPLLDKVKRASGGGVTFALGGDAVLSVEQPPGGPSEGVGLLAAVIVILISFGSLLAMGLPLTTALFGIGTGLAGIELLGHLLPAPSFTPVVSALIGLGVGVDYALFIVTRYREALHGGAGRDASHSGADPERATVVAITTAGRAVLFAGSTVVIALAGLFVMQQPLLDATAVAASVTVLATMAAAVTLLPALLGFAGRNIDRLRLPYFGRTSTTSPLAARWAGTIQRHPVIGLVAGAAVLLALAVPALSMRLGFADASTAPRDTSAYATHRMLADAFGPGRDAPLVIVTDGSAGTLRRVAAAVSHTPGVATVTPVRTSADGRAAEFVAIPTTGTQDAATPKLVHRLRDSVIPRAAAGQRVYVGGPNASTIDFADSVATRLPWLIAIVVSLSLVVLLVLVRSVVIAVKAAVMTLLSTLAAYGVLTVVVQWGWFGHALGFATAQPITTWVPLFVFPILFGLSTDYEVFLVSRIREEYDGGADTREAVRRGLASTARIITAAAAIMVLVFLTVLLGDDPAVKQFGLGLAVAVLLDATLVRMVLVPALMELLGAANWWLPRWLDRVLPGRPAGRNRAVRRNRDGAAVRGPDPAAHG